MAELLGSKKKQQTFHAYTLSTHFNLPVIFPRIRGQGTDMYCSASQSRSQHHHGTCSCHRDLTTDSLGMLHAPCSMPPAFSRMRVD